MVACSATRLGDPQEQELFLGQLDGVSDPETKRKIIGKLFIDVFQKYADQIEGAAFLAQGTLYPDVIESVSFSGGPSVTIKSHHNVGGLPEKMGLKLVEPLRELFKDEVRALGHEDCPPISSPATPSRARPFMPGEIRESFEILRRADAVYIDQIRLACMTRSACLSRSTRADRRCNGGRAHL